MATDQVYIVKFQGGASGVKRPTVKAAFATAVANAPARVYQQAGKANVLLGTTEANGRLLFTPAGEEAALAELRDIAGV